MSKRDGASGRAFWGDATDEACERYQTLVNSIDDGIYQLDAEERFVAVNDGIIEQTGYAREDLLGEHISVLFDTDAIGTLEREHERLHMAPDERSDVLELPVVTASGTRIQWELRVTPLVEDGTVQGTIGVARDVTERTRRAQNLTQQERRFEAVFEDPNILVGLLDPDGTVLDINQTAMEYIDADLDAVTGELFWETPWWGEGDGVQADVKEWVERAAAGEYVDFEADLTRPDGQQYVLEGVFRPVTNDDGEVVSVIVSDRDITERRQRERALEESEQRYRPLAEYFPNGIVTLFDPDLTYTLAAGQGFDNIPVEPAEVEGRHFRDVWDDDTAEALDPLFRAALDGRERAIEVSYAGREWVVHAVPITDDQGDVFAGMTMAQDITERKERQRQLEESERLYRTLAQNFPNGAVGVYDQELRYDLVEGALWDDIEPDAEDLVGNTIHEVFTEEITNDIEPIFRAAIENGETDSVVTEFVGRTLRVWTTPLRDSSGEIFAGLSFAQDITERKEREREIEESERRYRTLAENFPNGAVGLVDEDMRYMTLGGTPLTERDMTARDLEGRPVEEVLSPELGEHLVPRYRAALEGESSTFEYEHEDGEQYTRFRTFPVRDDEGNIFAAMGMSQDITDQVERERELERALDLLDKTERIADVGGWEIDVDTKDVFWTDHVFDLLEVSADEEPPLDEALDMYYEADQPIVEEAVENALDSGEPFEIEVRILTDNGERRWVRLQGVPETSDGEVVSVRGAAQDITERKERQRELQQSERQFEAVFNNPVSFVGLLDPDGTVRRANENALAFAGIEESEIRGEKFWNAPWFTHSPDVQAQLKEGIAQAAAGEYVQAEIPHQSPDGEICIMDSILEPVLDEDGDVVAIVPSGHDITALREREQFQRRLYDIVADPDQPFTEKLHTVLDLGCERFEMEIGGLASVDPETDRYEVDATNGDLDLLTPGKQYPLSETFCQAVVEGDTDICAVTEPETFDGTLSYAQAGVRAYFGIHITFDGADDRTVWFAATEPRPKEFTEAERTFLRLMGQWVQYELEHQHHTDQLTALNNLNAVVRDINRGLAQQSTREEIEQAVCEQLAESDSYEFAWIGRPADQAQRVVPTTTANAQGERADVAIPVTDDDSDQGLAATALRTGDPQIRQNVADASEFAPWHEQVHKRGFNCSAAIPITYEDQQYGVLNVYTVREQAFDNDEREVITQLGEIVGLAITAVEHEQKLEHERERLEFINRLVRHNLLNSLNVVRARTDILDGHVDPALENHLATVRDRAEDMIDLVQTLRSLMKVIVKEKDHELKSIDLDSVLDEELRHARQAFPDAEFAVQGDIETEQAVLADDLLGEVFDNVLTNAVQHNDKDDPQITISVEPGEEMTTVRIADNGPGVPPEMKEQIFQKGEKSFDSPGTGFGLHLVREIIDAYDGTITVEDNTPEGAVFTIAVPQVEERR